MTVIPQRDLRNKVSEILRRAEQGERFTVTVSGRPVAELGPAAGNGVAPREQRSLAEFLAEHPPDPELARDIARMRDEDFEAGRDPWAT